VVFGRLPEAGVTKTRLIPALGTGGAAALYEAFLDDALAATAGIADRELWVPGRPGAVRTLASRYPTVRIRTQPEGDLGARLSAAFETSFAGGIDYVVVLGSDHPTLPPDMVPRCFRALRGAHLAIGPTTDGGYYAIGLRRYCWPRARGLFLDAPWSSGDLLEWSRRRADELDLCHVELPAWYDVDEPDDLRRLEVHVTPDSRTGRVLAELWPAPEEERL
jgi:hypothetical protein